MKFNKRVWGVIMFLNVIVPIIYLFLYTLLRMNKLSMQTKDFVSTNGMFFWGMQLIACLIGLIFNKSNKKISIILLLLFILFLFIEFFTLKLFAEGFA